MRHNVFGKQLSRDTGQRQALLKGLAGALIRSEAIETTEAKAKAAQDLVEKLITRAVKGRLSDIRQIESIIADKTLIQKLVAEIAPRYKQRQGGYTRIIKLGTRAGDNAPMVRMELVAPVTEKIPASKPKAKTKTAKTNSK